MITANPGLDELKGVIRKVPHYPVAAKDVTRLAESSGADHEVVEFYRSFPDDTVFEDKEDLLVRTEAIEAMARDDQPREIYRAPEED